MSLFSKQKVFCNACGKELFIETPKMLGSKFRVCSSICFSEMAWRDTLSILGKEYYPRPENKLNDTQE